MSQLVSKGPADGALASVCVFPDDTEGSGVFHNVSGHHSHPSPARASSGAVSHSGVRVLLQTVGLLSQLGRHGPSGGRSRRWTRVSAMARASQPRQGQTLWAPGGRRSGVRQRASAGATGRTGHDGQSLAPQDGRPAERQ